MHFIRELTDSFHISERQVFFSSIPLNRKLIFWYARRILQPGSRIEPLDRLQGIDSIRRSGNPLTFICNHLTYADSHLIETLLMRSGFQGLADHLIHIAGQKTYEFPRRWFTRSLNTIRVYQPKARVDRKFKRRMNSRALKWAARMTRRGYSLLIFPEGTRTRRHMRFNLNGANPKTTVYFKNSWVIPIALMGAEKIMPIGKILQRPGNIVLRIGNPVDHQSLELEYRSRHSHKTDGEIRYALMQHYMQEIDNLLDNDYQYATD